MLKKTPVAVGSSSSIASAREQLQQGNALLANRQKHIKMADCSDQGCVSYEAEALADEK